MSSTTSTTASPSISQLITDALDNYTKQTGIDLTKNPFSDKLQLSDSPDGVIELFRERAEAFKEHRDGNRKLINSLQPAVQTLYVLSGSLGEAISLVPLTPAKAIFIGIDVLLEAASGVNGSYDALEDLFECIQDFLERLRIYLEIPPTHVTTHLLVNTMAELLSVLALATTQVKQGRFNKSAKKLLREREVEAVLQRLDRLTQEEARMTVPQALQIIHGLMNNMRVVLDDGEAWMDGIRQALVMMQLIASMINEMRRDQLQRDVQSWLSPPDPWINHIIAREAHHTGTAAWFLNGDVFSGWKETGSLLWVHGKMGSGKSILLSSIIDNIADLREAGLASMSYYYFDFKDAAKQGRRGMLASLLAQLSSRSDPCSDILSRLYATHDSGTRMPSDRALTQSLKEMLQLPGQGPIYIIVDALDECPDTSGAPSAREQLLYLVEQLVDLHLPHLHICVTSCLEVNIRAVLEPLTSFRVSLHDQDGQKQDIMDYITSVVRSDSKMRRWREEDRQLVIKVLSDKADGMFRWVYCQLEHLRLCLPGRVRHALDELPQTLDKTYEHALLQIDEGNWDYAHRLFQCLAVSIRPLHVAELAEVLAIDFEAGAHSSYLMDWRPEDAEEAVLSTCSSLISVVNVDGSQVVRFSHFSVKEFLTSTRLACSHHCTSRYYILLVPAHTLLAKACLSVLLQLDDRIDKKTIDNMPLAPYAARHWVDHAQFGNVSHTQDMMKYLFDCDKPHFATWVWVCNIDRPWGEHMSTVHPALPGAVPLYYAALCGFHDLAEHLVLTHPSDVNARGGYRVSPLHAALATGYTEIMVFLLRHGAEVNVRDNQGWTPLHWASQGGKLDTVRLLLEHRADINAQTIRGNTPLHLASGEGELEIARLLLRRGAPVDCQDNKGWTPLHVASNNGHLDVAQLLLDSDAVVNAWNRAQKIPLALASMNGYFEVSRLLIERGADVNSRTKECWGPLHIAARFGHLEVARLLLDRDVDVNIQEEDRWTPLHLASANGHLEMVKLLVRRGAVADMRNDKEQTPLDRASHSGHLEIARFLVEHDANVSSRCNKGWTPFHSASESGHLHIAEFVFQSGVNVDIRNGNEETALDLASGSGKLDVVRFLIRHGADVKARDNKGWNPLHTASLNGHLDIVQLLLHSGAIVDMRNGTQKTALALASSKGQVEVSRFLIEQGADVNSRDNVNWVPLHFAARQGHLDTARLLLDCGVDANVQDEDRWTPLHLASANGHIEVARVLVERGASIDSRSDLQQTPLDWAARNGELHTAHLLLESGANLHVIDNKGRTPLHTASWSGHLDVAKLLLRWGADTNLRDHGDKYPADLASDNKKAEVASFLAAYKEDEDVRNEIRSITLDTAQHFADEDAMDGGEQTLLQTAVEEGNLVIVRSCLERGADVNARDASRNTPLDLAARKGNVQIARLLIEHGAEVDLRNQFGWTPLHMVSRYGHIDIAQLLIECGANVNTWIQDYWTPIHISAANGYLEIVELLLAGGANPHGRNIEGRTPLQLAARRGYRKITELLMEHGTE